MLADPDILGNLAKQCFDPGYWAARGELTDVTRGRGAAWFVGADGRPWVLRHFRRGGFIAKLSKDRYVWAGERRVRAFAEWRLLAVLKSRGLPVPQPVAARYERTGWTYRCDLIIQRIVDAEPLSGLLARGTAGRGVVAAARRARRLVSFGRRGPCRPQRAQRVDRRRGSHQPDRLRPRPPAPAGRVDVGKSGAAAALAAQGGARAAGGTLHCRCLGVLHGRLRVGRREGNWRR